MRLFLDPKIGRHESSGFSIANMDSVASPKIVITSPVVELYKFLGFEDNLGTVAEIPKFT